MAITMTALEINKQITKMLNEAFVHTYDDYHRPIATGWFESYYITKKNHKYQVWLCGQSRKKLVAKNIRYRREALAVIKLLNSVKEQS